MTAPHLVGVAGDVPADAGARLRASLAGAGIGSPTLYESASLVVAFGPTEACDISATEAAVAIAAAVVFPGGTSPGGGAAERLRGAPNRAPLDLRFEGVVLASDLARRTTYVVRDHLGYGSLYWTWSDGCVVFASELKLLVGVLRRRPAPAPAAVALWLGLDNSRADVSLYEGIRQVPAGHRLVADAHGGRIERYWQPVYREPERRTAAEAVQDLKPVVLGAIEKRLAADGPTGVMMSGGVDSASVAGFARSLREEVVVYSDVFPAFPAVDESEWIDEVVRFLGVESVRSVPQPQGLLVDLAAFIEQWNAPPESANYWGQPLLQTARSDGVRTLLTGEGGDEVFAVRDGLIADMVRRGRLLEALRLARDLPQMLFYPPPRRLGSAVWDSGVSSAFGPLQMMSKAVARRHHPAPAWLTQTTRETLRAAADHEGWQRLDGPHWWANAAFDLSTRIPAVGIPALFRRVGEAVGCRVCSPLIDVDLVEASLGCAPELGFNGVLSKALLRGLAEGYLPDSVRLRRGKTLFTPMVVGGVRGADFTTIDELLRDPDAEIRAYVDQEVVIRALLDAPPGGDGQAAGLWAFHLYRLVALECWLRQEHDGSFLERLRSRDLLDQSFAIVRTNPVRSGARV